MAASSPRCIQQLATSPKPIPTKPISPPSLSPPQLTIPTSYSSECNYPPIPLYKPADHCSPTSTSPDLSTTSPSPPSPVPYVHTPPPQFLESKQWVATLLKTKFYGPCPIHAGLRKNDQNLFCIAHAEKICQYCYQADHPHKNTDSPCTILHVSRYMYHDVLLAKEAANLLDIAEVQSYLNNGNRVVYIDRRAQPKSKLAPHAKSCAMCSRTLQDPYRFCSLFCRLRHAKDPAAVETIPLPDASPLLHPAVKKVKSPGEVSNVTATSAARKLERDWKRNDPATPSPPRTLLLHRTNKAVKTKDVPSPLRLTSIKKRRRKAVPIRSPLPSATLLMLAEVATVFMCD